MKKRLLSILLVFGMMLTIIPVGAFTTDSSSIDASNVIESSSKGTHVHDKACGYVEAVNEISCGHIIDDEYSCIPEDAEGGYVCHHDDNCGYVVAVEGSPCTFVEEQEKVEVSCTSTYGCALLDKHEGVCAVEKSSTEPLEKAAYEKAVDLFAALPPADSITSKTTDEEKVSIQEQLDIAMAAYNALSEEDTVRFDVEHADLITSAKALGDSLAINASVMLIEPTISGICGAEGNEENVTWELTQNNDNNENPTYTLTFAGTGATMDYAMGEGVLLRPWHAYANKITKVVIGDGITTLGQRSCLGLAIKEIQWPTTEIEIGKASFASCTELEYINIPANIIVGTESNAAWTFSSCTGLKEVISYSNIKTQQFGGCESLKKVVVMPGVTEINYFAFVGCTNLKEISLPEGLKEFGAFSANPLIDLTGYAIDLPSTVISLGAYTFHKVTIGGIFIPLSVESFSSNSLNTANSDCVIYLEASEIPAGMKEGYSGGATVYSNQIIAHTNGGTFAKGTVHVAGKLSTPIKDGYVFAGWYDNAEFNGESATTAETGKTYYSKWVIDTPTRVSTESALKNAILYAGEDKQNPTVIIVTDNIELTDGITVSGNKNIILKGASKDITIKFSDEVDDSTINEYSMFYLEAGSNVNMTVQNIILNGTKKARLFLLGESQNASMNQLTLETGGVLKNGLPYPSQESGTFQSGGGVRLLEGSRFIMNDGVITENESLRYGGGIYSWASNVIVEINGGTISENKGSYAGGIATLGDSKLYLYGGNITNNLLNTTTGAGGIFLNGDSSLYLGGDVTVKDNQAPTQNKDIYLNGKTSIYIDRPLTGNVFFTKNDNITILPADSYTITENDILHLEVNDTSRIFYLDKENQIVRQADFRAIVFNANDNSDTEPKIQKVPISILSTLKTNQFTRVGYAFNGWNTQPDGKGIAYADQASVSLSSDIVLYAQWVDNVAPIMTSNPPSGVSSIIHKNGTIDLTFSEKMIGIPTIAVSGGAGIATAVLAENGLSMTIKHSNLAYATAYIFTINGITDVAGNALANNTLTYTAIKAPEANGTAVPSITGDTTIIDGNNNATADKISIDYTKQIATTDQTILNAMDNLPTGYTKTSVLFELALKVDGQTVNNSVFNREIAITIPHTVASNTDYKIAHLNADGNIEILDAIADLTKQTLNFKITSMSPFMVLSKYNTPSGGGGSSYSYYTITATAGSGGSISTGEKVSVREGDSAGFTFTPNKGYQIADVLVNGKSVGAIKTYIFTNIRSNQTIHVIFKASNGHANPQTGVHFESVQEND